MTSSFSYSLYLSTKHQYKFSYPIGSDIQDFRLRDALGLTDAEFSTWEPTWERLPMYERAGFINALANDFSYITEEHACREIALAKGAFYRDWQSCMGMIYRSSYTTLTYPEPIPDSFMDIVSEVLLKPYAVNKVGQSTFCDLNAGDFGIGMNPNQWNKSWLSMLTYFAKYGEFMCDISDVSYKSQFDLDQTIRAILDSWSGQVGFYTAFGVWLWANKNESAIHTDASQFHGIYNAMDHYAALYKPDKLLEFIVQYELSLHRVSRLYLDNHRNRCESLGLSIPSWYNAGLENDNHLAESPEWNDYMGYSDDDDDENYEDYDDDEDYDFEEEDW